MGLMAESFALSVLGIAAGIGIGIFAKVYESKVSPKFKKVDSKMVVIDAPTVGDVAFYR